MNRARSERYMGFPQTLRGWNGYITVSTNALSPNPLFYTAPVDDPRDPLVLYGCGVIRCENAGDFFESRSVRTGPPWVSFVDACSPKCVRQRDHDLAEGVVGRLTGIRLR